MARDDRWPERCTLMGCTSPSKRPHHHHYRSGHLDVRTCTCPSVDEPGTNPPCSCEVVVVQHPRPVARYGPPNRLFHGVTRRS